MLGLLKQGDPERDVVKATDCHCFLFRALRATSQVQQYLLFVQTSKYSRATLEIDSSGDIAVLSRRCQPVSTHNALRNMARIAAAMDKVLICSRPHVICSRGLISPILS